MPQPDGYPSSFSEYATQHPEVLPDYHAFANEIIHFVADSHNVLPVLIGPNGIGKTSRLIPALLEEGAKQGFQPLGSINLDMYLGGVAFDWHQHNGSSQDIYEKLSDEDGLIRISPSHNYRSSELYGEERLRKTLHQRFTEGRESGKPGLFIIDDLIQTADEAPWLANFLGKMADAHDVRLIATQPLSDYLVEGANTELYPEGSGAHDMQLRLVDAYYKCVNKFGRLVGQKPKIISIPEQLVSIDAIDNLLETYGLDKSNDKGFKKNSLLRRLRVVESLVEGIFAGRSGAESDDGRTVKSIVEFEKLYPKGGFRDVELRVGQNLTSGQSFQISKDTRGE